MLRQLLLHAQSWYCSRSGVANRCRHPGYDAEAPRNDARQQFNGILAYMQDLSCSAIIMILKSRQTRNLWNLRTPAGFEDS